MDTSAFSVTTIVAAGMGFAFLMSDWRSANNRLYAGLLVSIGVSMQVNALYFLYPTVAALPWWTTLAGLPIAAALWCAATWLRRVRQTIPAVNMDTRAGDLVIRAAQIASVVFGVLSVLFAKQRAAWTMYKLGHPGALSDPLILVLGLPMSAAIGGVVFAILLTLNRRPDRPEKVRLLAFVAALPFLVSGFLLSLDVAVFTLAAGLVVLLVGAVQYHMVQGRRGQFMSRFLSPQVAEMVNRQGLEQAIRDETVEISVLSCDIRGFTAFAQKSDSATVIALLRDYYDAVGAAATEVGATIKDYAGDGVLILIGAPLPCADHAQRALRLAQALRLSADAVVKRHQRGREPAGVALGIASGEVVVGVVGGARLEYVAVGATVNLAARLCQIARPGQILIDARAGELLGKSPRLRAESAELKGYAGSVDHFSLSAG